MTNKTPSLADPSADQRSPHVVIKFAQSPDLATLTRALSDAGLEPLSVHYTTAADGGLVLTQRHAAAIWQAESGYDHCPPPCAHRPSHAAWADLSTEQQSVFMRRYSAFLQACTFDELETSILLGDEPTFNGIALEPEDYP